MTTSTAPTNRIAAHPGALLLDQIREMGLTVHGVARDIGVPPAYLREIVRERRGVNAETATALGEYFGQTPEFWMNAQKIHEFSKALVENGQGVRARIRRRADDRVVS